MRIKSHESHADREKAQGRRNQSQHRSANVLSDTVANKASREVYAAARVELDEEAANLIEGGRGEEIDLRVRARLIASLVNSLDEDQTTACITFK